MKQDTNTKTPENAAKKRLPFVMQYRGNKSDVFSKRLRKTANISVIFTTRQMKTALPSLKQKLPENVRGNVVYEITCSGYQSSYVGQTTRHLATRVHEDSKGTIPVGEHLNWCGFTIDSCEVKIIDTARDSAKLLTLEALHINQRKPSINRKEEYKARELTLKLSHCYIDPHSSGLFQSNLLITVLSVFKLLSSFPFF